MVRGEGVLIGVRSALQKCTARTLDGAGAGLYRTFSRTLSRIKIIAMQNATPAAIAVLVLELVPAAAFGIAGRRIGRSCARWPSTLRNALPVLCALPYALISWSQQMFSWRWCALYAALPVAIAWLLGQAVIADPEQRGNWRDAIVL